MPKPPPRRGPANTGLTQAEAFGLIYRAVTGHAACLFFFVRKDFGSRVFELAVPTSLLLMFVYIVTVPCFEMLYFAAAWVALVIFHRLASFARRLRGRVTHSSDDGVNWLVEAVMPPGTTDFVVKAVCEPVLAIIAGALLCYISEKLGLFVMAASVSLVVKRVIEHGIVEAQYQAMADQEIAMRARMERYRRGP